MGEGTGDRKAPKDRCEGYPKKWVMPPARGKCPLQHIVPVARPTPWTSWFSQQLAPKAGGRLVATSVRSLESCLNIQHSFFHRPDLGMELLVPSRNFDIVQIKQTKQLASDPKPESRRGPSLDLLRLKKNWIFCSQDFPCLWLVLLSQRGLGKEAFSQGLKINQRVGCDQKPSTESPWRSSKREPYQGGAAFLSSLSNPQSVNRPQTDQLSWNSRLVGPGEASGRCWAPSLFYRLT